MHRESREPGFLLDLPDLPVNSDGGFKSCGNRLHLLQMRPAWSEDPADERHLN